MKKILGLALSLLFSMQTAQAQYFPPSGGGGGGAPDVSTATGILPAPNGGTGLAPDFTSKALNFVAASSQKVTLPNASALNPATAVTVEAWIKRGDDATSFVIFDKENVAQNKDQIYLAVFTNGSLQLYGDGETSGAFDVSSAPGSVPVGVWTHVAATITVAADGGKVYLNGVDATALHSNNTVGGFTVSTRDATIGFSGPHEDNDYSTGAVADLRIYNVARTANQIASDYRAALSAPYDSSLKAYYKTNEGSGASVVDAISANNGTASGGVTWVADGGLRVAPGASVVGKADQSGFAVQSGPSTIQVTGNYTVDAANGMSQILFVNTACTITLPAGTTNQGLTVTVLPSNGAVTFAFADGADEFWYGSPYSIANTVKQIDEGAFITVTARQAGWGETGNQWVITSFVPLYVFNQNAFSLNAHGALIHGDVTLAPEAAPSNPTSGWALYDDSGTGQLTAKKSDGTVVGITTPCFTSTDQTITAAGALTLAHGLSTAPKEVWMALVNQSTEAGYTAGQVVFVGGSQTVSVVAVQNDGYSAIVDATNLTIRYGSDASTFTVPHATTGAATAITNNKWKARFYAR